MSRPLRIALAAVALWYAAVACTGSTGGTATPAPAGVPPVTVAAGRSIAITEQGPVPRHLIAGPGDDISWRNDTPSDQRVTMVDGTESGLIKPGESFTRRFPTSGTFAYEIGPDGAQGLVEINLPEPTWS
ncbi:hypothetical protein [Spongiactinospora sp. 9N601]|uniref:hypothetical protein n=1 Tax=Spongiactinospora sp. 9N601 TaxID=3375149 RepID=UPI0037B4EE5C